MGCSFCRAPKPITPEQRLRINAIIDYWFDPSWDRNTAPAWSQVSKWFGKVTPEEIAVWDKEIKDQFEADYDNYMQGEYTGWPNDRDGRLAAILLCDQFPRNMFRASAKAFQADPQTARLAYKTLKNEELWKEYKTFEKMFILLPLQHAEDKALVQLQVEEYIKLDREVSEQMPDVYVGAAGKLLQMNIKFAQDHNTTMQRFGRYPHRNKYLGRDSTPEELDYLNVTTDTWAK